MPPSQMERPPRSYSSARGGLAPGLQGALPAHSMGVWQAIYGAPSEVRCMLEKEAQAKKVPPRPQEAQRPRALMRTAVIRVLLEGDSRLPGAQQRGPQPAWPRWRRLVAGCCLEQAALLQQEKRSGSV